MDQDEFVIFAVLDRNRFDDILHALRANFPRIGHGRQSDDYIWVHFGGDKIEVDSFYSMELEVKGRRGRFGAAREVLKVLDAGWVLETFDPPRVDMTR